MLTMIEVQDYLDRATSCVSRTADKGRTIGIICDMTKDEHSSFHVRVDAAYQFGHIDAKARHWYWTETGSSHTSFNLNSPATKLAVTVFLIRILGFYRD